MENGSSNEAPSSERHLQLVRLVLVAIAVPLLIVSWYLAKSDPHEKVFYVHLTLELSVGFLTFAAISWLIAYYARLTNPLGIVREFPRWLEDRPKNLIKRQFEECDRVHIIAVTLWRTLFDEPWFEEAFVKRIKAGKITRILILQPGGREIKRRQAQFRPNDERDLEGKNTKSNKKLVDIIEKSTNAPVEQFLKKYDYSPGMNWIRLGDTGYVVLLRELGGHSPGVAVSKAGLLFDHYEQVFEFMWSDERGRKGRKTPLPKKEGEEVGGTSIAIDPD